MLFSHIIMKRHPLVYFVYSNQFDISKDLDRNTTYQLEKAVGQKSKAGGVLNMEKVDIYNKFREKTGNVKARKELTTGEYRLSVHIWIKDSNNRILIEKRSEKEDKFPGMWAQVGGGVKSGDTSKITVLKECKEELGYDVKEENLFYIGTYIRTKDIVDIWMVNQNINIDKLKLQENEVAEVKLVTLEEFDEMIKSGEVVPSINPSYTLAKNFIKYYLK